MERRASHATTIEPRVQRWTTRRLDIAQRIASLSDSVSRAVITISEGEPPALHRYQLGPGSATPRYPEPPDRSPKESPPNPQRRGYRLQHLNIQRSRRWVIEMCPVHEIRVTPGLDATAIYTVATGTFAVCPAQPSSRYEAVTLSFDHPTEFDDVQPKAQSLGSLTLPRT